MAPRGVDRAAQQFRGPLRIALLPLEHPQQVQGRRVRRHDVKHLAVGLRSFPGESVRVQDTPQPGPHREITGRPDGCRMGLVHDRHHVGAETLHGRLLWWRWQ